MVEVASPGYVDMIEHFEAMGQFISTQEDTFFSNLGYIRGSRSRTDRYRREINNELNHVFYHAHSWADTGIESAYRSGWESVYGKEPYSIPPAMLQGAVARREQYRKKLNDMERHIRRDTNNFLNKGRKLSDDELIDREIRKTLPKITAGEVSDIRAGRRRYKLADWAKLQTKAAHQTSFNMGTIDAAKTKGVTVLEVSDGPGCGWTSHNDSDTANGKLVSPEEALANPIAHPNCQRQFLPREDLKGKPQKEHKKLNKKQVASAIVASLAAAGIARAAFQVTEEIVDPELVKRYQSITRIGRVYERTFNRLLDRAQSHLDREDAQIFHRVFGPPPPDPEPLSIAVGDDVVRQAAGAIHATYNGPPNLSAYQAGVMDWGEALLDRRITIPQLPPWVKKAIHATDSDSESTIHEKLGLFVRWAHGDKLKNKTVEEATNVVNFQAKRRQWNEFIILKNVDALQSAASFTWTKYGPRTRIDLTEFIRGRVTFTKDGIRRSITFNPAGNLRGMMALSQDGTLMGAVRLVPNRLFRAIIETDEFGKITGNVRLVPKNFPFKVMLEFETPRPKNWQYKGLVPGVDFVDLRATATEARGFGLQDFSINEVFGQLRQMQLKDIRFEANIYRKTPVRLSAELKIPIGQIRESIKTLLAEGALRSDGAGFTGTFRWRPAAAVLEELSKISAASGQKVLGGIRFSQLHVGFIRNFLPDISARAYFDNFQFRELLSSVRISGLDVIKNAKDLTIFNEILELPDRAWAGFHRALQETDDRITLFLQDHGIKGTRDVTWFIEERYRNITDQFGVTSRADIFTGTLEAIKGVAEDNVIRIKDVEGRIRRFQAGGKTHQAWLRLLADIQDTDSRATIERKIRDMVHFMRAHEFGNYSALEKLREIDDKTINLAAWQLSHDNARKLEVAAKRAAKLAKKKEEELARELLLNPELGSYIEKLAFQARKKLSQTLKESTKFLAAVEKPGAFQVFSRVDLFLARLQDIGAHARLGRYPRELAEHDGILFQPGLGENRTKVAITNYINRGKYPELWKETEAVAEAYEKTFPNMQPLNIRVAGFREFYEHYGSTTYAVYEPQSASVFINPLFAENYTAGSLAKHLEWNARIGHLNPIGARRNIVAHEIGHHIHITAEYPEALDFLDATKNGKLASRFFGEMFRDHNIPIMGSQNSLIFPDDPRYLPYVNDFLDWNKRNVSLYAGQDLYEGMAEIISYGMGTRSAPREVYNMLGKFSGYYESQVYKDWLLVGRERIAEEIRDVVANLDRPVITSLPGKVIDRIIPAQQTYDEMLGVGWFEKDANTVKHLMYDYRTKVAKQLSNQVRTAFSIDEEAMQAESYILHRFGFSRKTIRDTLAARFERTIDIDQMDTWLTPEGMTEAKTLLRRAGLPESDLNTALERIAGTTDHRPPIMSDVDEQWWKSKFSGELHAQLTKDKNFSIASGMGQYTQTSAMYNSWLAAGKKMSNVDFQFFEEILEEATMVHLEDIAEAPLNLSKIIGLKSTDHPETVGDLFVAEMRAFIEKHGGNTDGLEWPDEFAHKLWETIGSMHAPETKLGEIFSDELLSFHGSVMEDMDVQFTKALQFSREHAGNFTPTSVYRGVRNPRDSAILRSLQPGDEFQTTNMSSASPDSATALFFAKEEDLVGEIPGRKLEEAEPTLLEIIPKQGAGAWITSGLYEYIIPPSKFIVESVKKTQVSTLGPNRIGRDDIWENVTLITLREL